MICERTGFEHGSFEDTCKLNGMSARLKFDKQTNEAFIVNLYYRKVNRRDRL